MATRCFVALSVTRLFSNGIIYYSNLPARAVWMFSKLYNVVADSELDSSDHYQRREEWLKLAKMGAEFLRDHGKDQSGL